MHMGRPLAVFSSILVSISGCGNIKPRQLRQERPLTLNRRNHRRAAGVRSELGIIVSVREQ